MMFYVIVITFLMTLIINKYTSDVIPTYSQFIQMPNIDTKLGNTFYILKFPQWDVVMNNWNLDEKLLSDNNCNIVTL